MNKETLNKLLATAWDKGYSAGNLDGYFGSHDAATNPYTGVNPYKIDDDGCAHCGAAGHFADEEV